ncbi:hypothetical protein [Saccharothrix violaceirubra]|uniref:Uncharacterized protein n=1 Tax=Saccharothrix violaceirubra TaxID=413306 RepID=A0A7W7SXZ8_9PSEU|nr:hypothetical protein [Saccharothrix violaceirubra]MBB4963025.1 hypothetical protein [Saccharothrix violaceirubra]
MRMKPTAPRSATTLPSHAVVPPMTPGQFVREIGEWLAVDPSTVDKMRT